MKDADLVRGSGPGLPHSTLARPTLCLSVIGGNGRCQAAIGPEPMLPSPTGTWDPLPSWRCWVGFPGTACRPPFPAGQQMWSPGLTWAALAALRPVW